MPYPNEIDQFNEKLNKKDTLYVIEEEVVPINGVYNNMLTHDNIVDSSLRVYTGSKLTGERVDNFILSIPGEMKWKRLIKIFSNAPKLYITYESYGDQVEAEDINRIQESMIATQAEIDRYKQANDLVVTNTINRVTILEKNKADKTYVDQISDYLASQHITTGGGTITYSSDFYLKWTVRVGVVPIDKSISSEGFIQVDMPAVGTVIQGAFGTPSVTVVDKGILLPGFTALFAEHNVGSLAKDITLKLLDFTGESNGKVPHNWIPIAVRNTDSNALRFCTGQTLTPGDTIVNGKPSISYIKDLQSTLDSKETTTGAQAKATQAENSAKLYADGKFATKSEISNAGYGDMLKSVYDSDNDGVVDAAKSAPWSGVTDKPTTFPPSTHNHSISEITNLQTTLDSTLSNAKAYAMNMVSVGSSADPNTTQESYILTNHANSPGGGLYWHILTLFYSSKTGNRAQIAVTYSGASPRLMIRHIYGTTWTAWVELLNKRAFTWNDLKGV